MTIGIDVSQIVYGTGVGNSMQKLVFHLIAVDKKNDYVLFGSSLRKRGILRQFKKNFDSFSNVKFLIYPFPPSLLDIIWNKLHILPIEWLIGKIDVFISSDWTQPPTTNAKKVTIIHDMVIFTNSKETDSRIIAVQKRRLSWVKTEIDKVICVSEATKLDTIKLLGIPEERLTVVYPGF